MKFAEFLGCTHMCAIKDSRLYNLEKGKVLDRRSDFLYLIRFLGSCFAETSFSQRLEIE